MAKRVLLVDMVHAANDSLQQSFEKNGFSTISCKGGMKELETHLKENGNCRAVVVNVYSPNSEMFKTLKNVINQYGMPVVVFTNTSNRQFAEEAANTGISAYIVDGFEPGRIKNIMDLAEARCQEIQAIKTELARTKLSLDERKVIEKAKGILMRRRTMDEDSAFKLMRKMAMDKNQRLAEVAKNIVHVDTLFT